MLLLAALAAASPLPPQTQAKATVRIFQAARVTKADWDSLPAERRREVTVREKDGRAMTVRLIEFE